MGMDKELLKERQRARGYAHQNNLVDITTRPPEERRAICAAGGRASIEARKRKRAIKEICDDILGLSATELTNDATTIEMQERLKRAGVDASIYDVIVAKQAEMAAKGNTKAAAFVRDSAGDAPAQMVTAEISTTTDDDRALLANLSNRIEALEAIDTTANDIMPT